MNGAGERSLAAHNAAIHLARAGDLAGAVARLREAVAIAGLAAADPRTLKALAQLAIESGDWRSGLAAAIHASVRDPADYPFAQKAVQWLAQAPVAALAPEPVAPPAAWPRLSVVLVSADDARFAAADAEFERAFRAWPHERIRIRDARSMYDGYARGFAASRGEVVVFSHDDIRFATPDFAARLAHAIAAADMVGVVGSTRLTGPALTWDGHPHLFGSVVHYEPQAGHYEFGAMSLRGPLVPGAQALDGVFIAARREWVERTGFDPEGIAGFHFYDVDFSYRAHRAGARVAVAADLGLVHLSRGAFDSQWTVAQAAFARKHGLDTRSVAADRHFYGLRLPDLDAVAALYAKLTAARSVALA